MLIIRLPVVIGTVFGGYATTGGHRTLSTSGVIIIGGAGIGAFIVGNNGKAIKGTVKAPLLPFKVHQVHVHGSLALLYRLMAKSRQQGCSRWSGY
ncbi:motility-associated protein [Yokenella regensburgei]|uniref:motility-associated protein n=1 Tax=Yokenella regensburgei TaxID=158877 RepID=UPI0031585851